jgi:DNA-binding transcriptional regulator GbsR (MarR family)
VTPATTSPAIERVVDFLGDLGSRWGLPVQACRVHGYLYLIARPLTRDELRAALSLNEATLGEALAWLAEFRLIERVHADAWRTEGDPWELMMRALEERQRREVGPALDLLRDCRRAALAEGKHQRAVAGQIDKLTRLVEDLASISGQSRRLSASTVRQIVGLGGLAARMLDRTLGRKEPPKERT